MAERSRSDARSIRATASTASSSDTSVDGGEHDPSFRAMRAFGPIESGLDLQCRVVERDGGSLSRRDQILARSEDARRLHEAPRTCVLQVQGAGAVVRDLRPDGRLRPPATEKLAPSYCSQGSRDPPGERSLDSFQLPLGLPRVGLGAPPVRRLPRNPGAGRCGLLRDARVAAPLRVVEDVTIENGHRVVENRDELLLVVSDVEPVEAVETGVEIPALDEPRLPFSVRRS